MSTSDSKKERENQQEYSTMSDSKFGGKENVDSMSDSSFGREARIDSEKGSGGNKKAEEHHRKLSEQRVKDGKINMRQSVANSGKAKDEATKSGRNRIVGAAGVSNIKKNAQTAVALGGAFTAINPVKDMIHYLVIGIAILADVFTLIPLIGTLVAIPFILATWIIYGINGHFRKSPEKKIVVMVLCYIVELIFSTVPTFTVSALANYWLVLAERKVAQSNQEEEN